MKSINLLIWLELFYIYIYIYIYTLPFKLEVSKILLCFWKKSIMLTKAAISFTKILVLSNN